MPLHEALALGQRRVTPRQACPRPSGFGRNLRSKTRWFTGFCNSHQVSHFATFFIDARAEISVAESHFRYTYVATPAARAPSPGRREHDLTITVPWHGLCRGLLFGWEQPKEGASRRGGLRGVTHTRASPPCPGKNKSTSRTACEASTMILPQVHLRKPCYDFSFL